MAELGSAFLCADLELTPEVRDDHASYIHHWLQALKDDHAAADLHLDEFDRAELAREFPELEADKVPTVEELRSRYDMIAGGML